MQKIGRNDPCGCHSGLKYKRCCGKTASFDAEGNTYFHHVPLKEGSGPEVGARDGFIIVKVQTSLTDPNHPAMIYDRERAFQRFVDADQVTERMAGRPKAFFYARLSYGQLVLVDEAPEQPW